MPSPSRGVALGPDAKVQMRALAWLDGSTGVPVGTTDMLTRILTIPLQTFAVLSGTCRETGDDVDLSDTDNAPRKTGDVGNTQMEAELELNRDKEAVATGLGTFHAQPSYLSVGTTLELRIYPYGLSFDYYAIPLFQVSFWEASFTVRGSEQQTFRLRGKSNGPYKLLGNLGAF